MIAATSLLGRRLWPRGRGARQAGRTALTGMIGFTAYAGLTMFDTCSGLAVLLGVLALGGAADVAAQLDRARPLAAGLGVLAKGQ